MRYIIFAVIFALTGCTTTKDPKVTYTWAPSPPMSRQMATKEILLYAYQIGIGHRGNYERALTDATNWCTNKFKLSAVERKYPECTSYSGHDGVEPETICIVEFKCQ